MATFITSLSPPAARKISKMRVFLVKFREVTKKYPVVRGMASYTVIWPVASLIQQKIIGKENLDFVQAARFSIYGGCFVAPTLYCWLRVASHFWPKSDIKSAITKVIFTLNSFSRMCIFILLLNVNYYNILGSR